jgi:hypothetical protein
MKKIFILVLAGLFCLSVFAPSISQARGGGQSQAHNKSGKIERANRGKSKATINKHKGKKKHLAKSKKKGSLKGKKKGKANRATRATPAEPAIPTPGEPGATKAVPAIPAEPAKAGVVS